MCTPLAGGALGWGLSQQKKPEEKNTTINYYGAKPADVEPNKEALKADPAAAANTQRPQGPAQSSKTDRAY
tara:strand:+ start:544 stop:756 length:213 start_codon:yes stop_codon:yes gene_type:complete